ncbi:ATP-binding cassette domain-containing protein [Paenibacillus sp. CN-4]|uniref:ABC transporter ATP-binding protein n=1 Tax=Paenibacillus nanchangensis TaxID=3348343 RepID=UPI00397C28C6
MSEYSIETRGLTRRFGSFTSVDHLELRVPKGQIYGFLGANGAGKTTTIRMLLSLMRPDEGEIRILGLPLEDNRDRILRRVGSLVESPSYYGHLSAYKNLKILADLLDLPDQRIGEALETVRLTPYAKQAVKGFSLGMKQRLALAQALIRKPEVLILDEPINGLDPAGIQEIRNLLLALSREQGVTVFLSSHILSEIQAISDRVGIIQGGKLIFQDAITELERRSRPRLAVETDQPEEACRLLLRHGASVERRDRLLLITLNEQLNQADIFRILQPVELRHVSEQVRSLEDIFLDLTGRGGSL